MYSTLTHSTLPPNTDNTPFHTALIETESNNPLGHYYTTATNVATATTNATTATTVATATTITTAAIIFATTVTATANITTYNQNYDENNPLVHYYANKLKYINVQNENNRH